MTHLIAMVNENTLSPRHTLANLGIVLFPGAIAFQPVNLAKILSLSKSGICARMKAAGWETEVFCPSLIKQELSKLLGGAIKFWTLRSIPVGSRFEIYMNENPVLITGQAKIKTKQQCFAIAYDALEFSDPVSMDC
jgi:hypothetical protein